MENEDKLVTEYEVKEIFIKDIFIGDNSRLDIKKEDLSDLMDSIKKHGLLQAIGVIPLPKDSKKKAKYKIVYGNRRLAAFKKLRRKSIPATLILDIKEAADQIILNLTENEHRKNIDSFEFGRYCCYLIDNFDFTMKEIAVNLSVTQNRIKAAMQIFRCLPSEFAGQIKSMQNSGERSKGRYIPPTYAQRIVQMKRKYRLNKKQVSDLLNLVKKNKKINNTTLDNIMYFLSKKIPLDQSIEKSMDAVVQRFEFSMKKEEASFLLKKYGSIREGVHQLIYSTGKITNPREDI